MPRSAVGYGPPSRHGARHDRCQAESSRESRYVCFPAISAASPSAADTAVRWPGGQYLTRSDLPEATDRLRSGSPNRLRSACPHCKNARPRQPACRHPRSDTPRGSGAARTSIRGSPEPGFLDDDDPDRRSGPLLGLIPQACQTIEQPGSVTAGDRVLRHLLAAWRQRGHEPPRSAQFQRNENRGNIRTDGGIALDKMVVGRHRSPPRGVVWDLSLPEAAAVHPHRIFIHCSAVPR